MRRLFSATLVLRSLGLLLLVAAGLKAYGLAVDPVSPLGLFSAGWFQVGLIELEVLLGLWLLSGVQPLAAWLVASALFGCFAVFSLYQGLVGQTSCGCFGQLSVSPWHALGLDVLALVALALGRPERAAFRAGPRPVLLRPLTTGAGYLAGAAALLGPFAGAALYQFGSLEAAAAYLRGERIVVDPGLVDVGTGAAGELREVRVEVANFTDRPVRVIGGTSDCSCGVTSKLPQTIPAGGRRAVDVTVRLPGRPGIFTRPVALFIDDGRFQVNGFRLTGRSRASDEAAQVADGE